MRGESITVQDIANELDHRSFAALIMIFALLAASPASAIPGLTATVGLAVAILLAQMLVGWKCVWLPGVLARRRLSSQRICQGIAWLRRPVHALERILRPRMSYLIKRPGLFVPLSVMLCLALFMPVMEIVPTSGSIAGVVIALFAAGILVGDGLLISGALMMSAAVPFAVWWFGFS